MIPHELLRARPDEFGDRSFEQAGQVFLCTCNEPVACDGCQIGHGRCAQQVTGGLGNRHDLAALDCHEGSFLGQQQPFLAGMDGQLETDTEQRKASHLLHSSGRPGAYPANAET